MLNRLWTWTSPAAGEPAETSLPFGPLRYRGWTSGGPGVAVTGLPFGPLRYRAWTSGPFIPPIEPPIPDISTGGGFRIWPDFMPQRGRRRIIQEDDEIMVIIAAWLHTTKGRQ